MTPEEWLANFESKIADVREKAAEFQENLEASGASAASGDGSIRVTVAPNGSLTDLVIADSAVKGSGTKLAEDILKLARKAQREAAVHVAEAFAPLGGDSAAMHMVTGYLPPEEPAEPEPPGRAQERQLYVPEEPDLPAAPPPPPPPPPARPRRPRPDDDDEDFGDSSFLRRN